MRKNKTLVIGWDAADWKFLTPLMDQGLMPNLTKLVEGGVSGKLSTLDPPLSPTLWTSIATGKRPYKHGIHGFSEPRPDGKGLRPMNITTRKCKAIWNIFTQHDLKSHVVGWWPSHPAEPINGTMISNLYQRSKPDQINDWPMPEGTVHPKEKAELYKNLRVHIQEITGNHVDPLIPRLAEIDQEFDKRPKKLPAIISDSACIHSAATYILEHEDWDFVGVYYDAIDHTCHHFMQYHPPHRPHIPLRDYEYYKDVVKGTCIFHDMMLGRLLDLAGEDTNVILISDHGFHPDHNRPIVVPKEPMGPAKEHSPYGVIVMNGPDFKKDELIYGASLLDITPTLLQLYDLPVGKDMDGKVLVNAFAEKQKVKTIDSWEMVEGEDGSHPEGFEMDDQQAEEELQQLIDLGYIEDYGDDTELAIKMTKAENKFTLAKAYIDGNEWRKGIDLIEELYAEFPTKLHFPSRLIHAYQVTSQLKKARKVIDEVKEIFPNRGAHIDLMEASLYFVENKPKAALSILKKVKSQTGTFFDIDFRIAGALFEMNEFDKALIAINDHLKKDPESERAYLLKGRILFRQGKYEEALEELLNSLGLEFHKPAAHFLVGECLYELKQYEDAIKAYEKCLSFGNAFNNARARIVHILTTKLGQPGRARRYQIEFEDMIVGTINIVSGLPRSGTSLMMQMLEAGGQEIFTDKQREADESNPKGYYEHEAIKNLKKKSRFLDEAVDKTAKVISNLVQYLPTRYKYRVVFMNRDLMEIIRSQQKMLIRDGKKIADDVLPLQLLESYEKGLKMVKLWMKQQRNIEFIEINYTDVLDSPFEEALKINDFFSGTLNPEAMAAIPDTKLYRERTTKKLEV